jgi:hypothetical protein
MACLILPRAKALEHRRIKYFKLAAMKLLLLTLLLALPVFAAEKPGGVKGDGQTDDTAALQAALDAAGKTGGVVELPSGQYLIAGALKVPTGVTLQGSWEEPHHAAYDKGSTLFLTGGRGDENAPPAIALQQSSAIKGFTLLWPEQKWPDVVPYPWAIQGIGMHNTIENITFANAYNGIRIGNVQSSELHLIRNVFGCVLRRGVFVDSTTDIGRIENVHFNPHYWSRSGHSSRPSGQGNADMTVAGYMADNLEAFIFGRTDWEYVANTFVFAAKVGYRFIQTPAGACNGQFMGIGGDYCRTCVQIDAIQNIGIQVTNGEFTSHAGDPKTAIVTSPGAGGAAQFVNCNFWANPGNVAFLQGNTAVTFGDCHFVDTPPNGAIVAEHGKLIVRGCTFDRAGTAVVLKPGVKTALITSNLQPAGLQVSNEIGTRAQIGFNEEMAELPVAQALHYRLKIGAKGDEDYALNGWWGQEGAGDAPPESGSQSARWTMGNARLLLPVKANTAYTMKLWVSLPKGAPLPIVSATGGAQATMQEGQQVITLQIPAADRKTVEVSIKGDTWQPIKLQPPLTDARDLGARAYAIEMIAQGSENTAPAELN